ncbi:40S ribosomal protein S25 [Malassezia cuniculi]|uniref:40S ribosomal protein S25 n=1 Tax=Malassezia cuniculi TaxID=948313 RepID=A0AAF0EUZ7_9BASI|nr:40S ribosomal protein S25 [Malassezia cuniculi]
MSTDVRKRVVPKLVEIDENGVPIVGDMPAEHEYARANFDDEYSDDEDEPLAAPPVASDDHPEELSERTEFIFTSIFWTLPFCFLFMMLDVLVQVQYAQQPNIKQEFIRVIQRVPLLVLYIVWSLGERRKKLVQFVLFAVGTVTGAAFIHITNKTVKTADDKMPPKKAAILAAASKTGKKKKWSKGRVKDRAQNAVALDKPLYERVLKEVPTFKMITPSILIDRLKINGSLARVAIRHFEREGQIKRVIHHHGQLVYTRTGSD